jgi:hypothetical protein
MEFFAGFLAKIQIEYAHFIQVIDNLRCDHLWFKQMWPAHSRKLEKPYCMFDISSVNLSIPEKQNIA